MGGDRLNHTAIMESLVLGRPLDNHTFGDTFHDVRIPNIQPPLTGCVADVINAFKTTLRDKTPKDVALLLSGGKDSRMIAGILKELGKNVTCYNYHTDSQSHETKISQKIAKILGFSFCHIPLNADKYYNEDHIQNIIKHTDGSPIFHELLMPLHIKDLIHEDVIITGDLVTEIQDTAEYFYSKHGNNLRHELYHKEKLRNIICEDKYNKVLKKLGEFYFNGRIEEVIVERKRDRIIRNRVLKKMGIDMFLPSIDKQVLDATFAIKLKNRQDGKLVYAMIKKINKDLLKIRTALAPAWVGHSHKIQLAYSKATKNHPSNDGIKGNYGLKISEIKKILPSLCEKYDFIKHEKTLDLVKAGDKQVIYRMDNLRQWEEHHG